ncbi:MAG: hypothetical protein QS721_04645 [Candidatus Endonucleobacter sp. (ex Gigantidas childressi)]|nr:hypothetical protein [Candidatus Endonucleobacter sp. (ex Gigantidas childressi)]
MDDLVMIGTPVVAILVVICSPVILSDGHVNPVDWRWGFTEGTMVFTCLAAIIVIFGWRVSGFRLLAANYGRWAESSEQYLRGKKFEQLGYLFNKYHE